MNTSSQFSGKIDSNAFKLRQHILAQSVDLSGVNVKVKRINEAFNP
jgi:hypothetical protein